MMRGDLKDFPLIDYLVNVEGIPRPSSHGIFIEKDVFKWPEMRVEMVHKPHSIKLYRAKNYEYMVWTGYQDGCIGIFKRIAEIYFEENLKRL